MQEPEDRLGQKVEPAPVDRNRGSARSRPRSGSCGSSPIPWRRRRAGWSPRRAGRLPPSLRADGPRSGRCRQPPRYFVTLVNGWSAPGMRVVIQYLSVNPIHPSASTSTISAAAASRCTKFKVGHIVIGDLVELRRRTCGRHPRCRMKKFCKVIGQAVARDDAIGCKPCCACPGVLDGLRDREHEVLVDRDGPAEDQARAVLPDERHRCFGG